MDHLGRSSGWVSPEWAYLDPPPATAENVEEMVGLREASRTEALRTPPPGTTTRSTLTPLAVVAVGTVYGMKRGCVSQSHGLREEG